MWTVGLLQLGGPLLEGVLEPPLLGLVADDFQEPPNLVGVVLQRHDEPLGLERLAAFPQVPAFIECPAFGRRGPHLLVRLVGPRSSGVKMMRKFWPRISASL